MNRLEDTLRKKIENWYNDNVGKAVFLYGCSTETMVLIDLLTKMEIRIEAILDGDVHKEGNYWCGSIVVSPEYCMNYGNNGFCVFVWSLYQKELLRRLYDMGCGEDNIFLIDIERDSEEYLECRLEYLVDAKEVFGRIRKHHPKSFYFVAPKASGDIYISLAYIKAWMEQKRITENICLIGQGRNASDLSDLYALKDYENVTEDEHRKLVFLSSIMGEKLKLKLLSPWELNIRNSFFPKEASKVCFIDKYRYEVFDLARGTKGNYPKYLEGGCTKSYIVLAPYAYSSPAPRLSLKFWQKLADEFNSENYKVYTISYSEREPVLKGTDVLRFSYADADKILSGCIGFVAERSGLCDIVHNLNCKQVILFSNKTNPSATKFYGMKENYEDYCGVEINCDDISEIELIDMIKGSVL